jgi:2-polyprenyl-3-methyl-5-hydroxy-6-metoxy-1,4-benzoquinol methylase
VTSLREQVFAAYISSSSRSHRPLSSESLARFKRAYAFHLRGWLPAGEHLRWLDLGCGQGALLSFASDRGFETLGVDGSDQMVAAARGMGLNVTKGDALQCLLSQASSSSDVVSIFDVLEHVDRNQGLELLKETERVLRPGGICVLKLPNAASPWGFAVTASDLTHESAYAPESLTQLAVLAGFSRVQLREVGPAPLGVVSGARFLLWPLVRLLYRCLSAIETGSPGSGIESRIMLARLSKTGE